MGTGSAQSAPALDCPVAWPRPGEGHGLGRAPFWDEQLHAWVVSGYADVEHVLQDATTFSSRFAFGPGYDAAFDSLLSRIPGDPRVGIASKFFRMIINAADGEVHRRERSFIAKAFVPKRIRPFEAPITAWCEELTGVILERTGVPFVEAFAVPLPTKVIAHGLGVAPDDHRNLKRWSDGFQGPIGDTSPEKLEAFVQAAVEFTEYISPIVEARRRAPADDLISVVVGPNDAGERLATDDVLAMCMVLMIGGNETITAALAGAMLYLVRAPHVQAGLRADPARIPVFVEEALRLVTPPQMMFRTATADTELAGVAIGRGEHLVLRPGAANRDAAQFGEPLVPRLDRPDRRHLSFGRGAHVCPGAPLARTELRIALETLLARTSAITLAGRDDAVVPAGNPMTASVGELYLDVHGCERKDRP